MMLRQVESLQDRPVNEELIENIYFAAVACGFTSGSALLARARSVAGTFDLSVKGLNATDARRMSAVVPSNPALERFEIGHLLAQSFRPVPSWIDGLVAQVRALGGDVEGLERLASELKGLAALGADTSAASLLGSWAARFADCMRGAFVEKPALPVLLDLVGWRSDDPEWRLPIRQALAASLRTEADFGSFVARLEGLFELTPGDLISGALVDQHRAGPRGVWLKLVEYADRCGALDGLLAAAREPATGRRIGEMQDAYGRWSSAVESFLAQRVSRLS
jgi:hypothetical protein